VTKEKITRLNSSNVTFLNKEYSQASLKEAELYTA